MVLYKPSEVINWDIDETTGLVNRVKIRQISTEANPFSRSRYQGGCIPVSFLSDSMQAPRLTFHQPQVPAVPLKGPTMSDVIQPP